VLRARGELAEALETARKVVERGGALGASSPGMKFAFVEMVEAALDVDLSAAEQITEKVAHLPLGQSTPYLRAQGARFRALRDSSLDRASADSGFKEAVGRLREIEVPFWLAVTLLEQGEWLVARGRADESEPLLAEAGEILQRLGARPWLERLALVRGGASEQIPLLGRQP
jgi:hypothetical protein